METATNDAATVAPAKDFLIKDYELKVRYLTDHYGRMWTLNYFSPIFFRSEEELETDCD